MSSEPRRKFDQDFKRNAVFLCAEPGRSVVEVAENSGIGLELFTEHNGMADSPMITADLHDDPEFDVKIPNTAWVSDFPYLKVGR